jgi:hypothetical protein
LTIGTLATTRLNVSNGHEPPGPEAHRGIATYVLRREKGGGGERGRGGRQCPRKRDRDREREWCARHIYIERDGQR